MTFKIFQGVRKGAVGVLAVFEATTKNTAMHGKRALGYAEELDAASIRDEISHLRTALQDAFSHEVEGLEEQMEQYGRGLEAIEDRHQQTRGYSKQAAGM